MPGIRHHQVGSRRRMILLARSTSRTARYVVVTGFEPSPPGSDSRCRLCPRRMSRSQCTGSVHRMAFVSFRMDWTNMCSRRYRPSRMKNRQDAVFPSSSIFPSPRLNESLASATNIIHMRLVEQLVDRGVSLCILLQHLGNGHFLYRRNHFRQRKLRAKKKKRSV